MSREKPPALLEVTGLDAFYGRGPARTQVLHDVGFQLGPGEALGVIGETGSGKTTVARAVLGLVEQITGSISVDGTEIATFTRAQRQRFRKSGILQYVFQDPLRSLDPERALGESLAEPLELQGTLGRTEIRDRIERYLDTVALDPSILTRFPGEVSGGQRQRVAIARALITEPRVIILDEPVSALDSANRVKVLEILSSLRDSGVALLFISHDLGSVAGLTDRALVLYRGRVVEDRPTGDLVNAPQHPYSKLLIGSAPTLVGGSIDRAERDALRAALAN